ncbi:MAG: hypothetical protein K2Y12_13355 [Chitinophagaceae bacterium]|nr:hypothetical protein [Chitinophagaceae bacterium]
MHHNTEDGQDQQSADQENSTGRSIDADDKTPSTEASSPAEQPQTNNPKPVTDNMEVHHHTHHPKKWKEYFWEFFMLFLAVFCGSLAELQLEHYIEHQREKKFANQLVLDLNSDEKNLLNYIEQQTLRSNRIDSLFTLIDQKEFDTQNDAIYFLARVLSRYGNYVPTDGTISQLKFGGNLRLIKNNEIVANILDYDNNNKVLVQFIGTSFQDVLNYRIASENLFDAGCFYKMTDISNEILRLKNCPPAKWSNREHVNMFLMRLQYMKGANLRYLNLANELLKKERDLKRFIVKHYQ